MGSLASRPKVPKAVRQPQVITVASTPRVAAPSTIQQTVTNNTVSETSSEPDTQDVTTSAREQNLLNRSRGRLSTVLTGFRGVLSQSNQPQRKTLLGE